MGAPLGNQFWKIRSKHGRDKLFATPELLWEAATEYFEWCENNDLTQIDFRGKDADEVRIPKIRPFTLHGLCLYLDCSTGYFKDFKLQKRLNAKDFIAVITRIEETIYDQKYVGSAAGFFNPNIIARDLGLIDKKEVATDLTLKSDIDYTKLDDATLEKIIAAKNSNDSGK